MNKKLCVAPIVSALVVLLLCAILAPAIAFAEEETLEQKGSIAISLEDFGTPMQNVEFWCYQVGYMREGPQLIWELVPGLEQTNVDLNALKTAKDLQTAAQELHKAVETQKLSGVAATTDAAGRVRWDDLTLGVYLLVQTETAQYGQCEPFLVAIPYVDDSGKWSYLIEASVKGAPLESPTPSSEPTTRAWLPQTGDLDHPGVWLALLCLAGITLIVLFVGAKYYRKR